MAESRGVIGIFDSGVGGLTVFKAISERLPGESMIYLGDTARVPYGTKSANTVVRYARACARVLLKANLKLLVVACNTASAYALDVLRDEVDAPVLGVIEPGARAAAEASAEGRIGVIGTAAAIGSGAYQDAIRELAPGAEVHVQACPLFVPLAEEGWTEGPVPEQVAERYLRPLKDARVDTLVLGCTHYPLLTAVIRSAMGPEVRLVDSAGATAAAVAETLGALGAEDAAGDSDGKAPVHRFLVTDGAPGFAGVGACFLGSPLNNVECVDI